MPAIPQQKATAPGRIHAWDLDLPAMQACAAWARREPGLLQEELQRISRTFPTFVATAGAALGSDRCWVEAAEPLLCPRCEELVIFDRGTRCARCLEPIEVSADAVVGVVGRVPALISGRPFSRALERRMARLQDRRDPRASLFADCVLDVGGRRYLAPRYGLWFSHSWPHSDPPVMVWPEYFDVLDIPPDHVFDADPYYRLCLYASWREQPACDVLQNRVVPRLLIDLMVADLQALGRLDQALERLDTTLYALYNVVGRPREVEPFQQVYEELVGR
jgi:hypothetical protein